MDTETALLSLPPNVLEAIAGALLLDAAAGNAASTRPTTSATTGALSGLRGTCRQLRATANMSTRQVRSANRCMPE